MRRFKVKTKIAVWLTLLIGVLTLMLLGFLLSVSGRVAQSNASRQLSNTVRQNAGRISVEDGTLKTSSNFMFYSGGVYSLVYNRGGALVAGQLPVAFTAAEPFENGVIRTIETERADYYILDLWVPESWDSGFWIRGLIEVPEQRETVISMLGVTLFVMPIFMALAALGSYFILKRAFRPLDHISVTASAINEARDLSRRINLPPGKDEFFQLADVFDQLLARLESAFETEKQFASDASHELRTPVSIIKSACETAEKYDETPEERKESLEIIHRQAEVMTRLIEQLLSMTRMEQGTELIQLEEIDLGEFVRIACKDIMTGAYEKSLSLDLEDGIIVCGDRALLTRLLQNLIDNACKYGKDNGHIWVSVGKYENEAFLRVADDGIGIPKEQQDKVWRRFFRADEAHSGESGAGLGLAIVKQIADVHKGYMTLESVPDRGSVFTLYLPIIM